MTHVIGVIASNVASAYHAKNDGNIEKEVFEKIGSLLESKKDELRSILITDAYYHNNALEHKLYEIVTHSLSKYQVKHNTPGVNIAKGAAASAIASVTGAYFGGGYRGAVASQIASNAAIDLPLGYIEASGALDHVVEELQSEFDSLAKAKPSTSNMMEEYLSKELSNDETRASEIMNFIMEQDSFFIENGEIQYKQCDVVESTANFNLGQHDSSRIAVKSACDEVAKFLELQYSNFDENKGKMSKELGATVFQQVSGMWERGVVQSVARLPLGIGWAAYQHHENIEKAKQVMQGNRQSEHAVGETSQQLRDIAKRFNEQNQRVLYGGRIEREAVPQGQSYDSSILGETTNKWQDGFTSLNGDSFEVTVDASGRMYTEQRNSYVEAAKIKPNAPIYTGQDDSSVNVGYNGKSNNIEQLYKNWWHNMQDSVASNLKEVKDFVSTSGTGISNWADSRWSEIQNIAVDTKDFVVSTWDSWFGKEVSQARVFASAEYEKGYQQFRNEKFARELSGLDLFTSPINDWRLDVDIDRYLRIRYEFQQQTGKQALVGITDLFIFSVGSSIEKLEVKYPEATDKIKHINSKIESVISKSIEAAGVVAERVFESLPRTVQDDLRFKRYVASLAVDWVGEQIKPIIRDYLEQMTPEHVKVLDFAEGVGNFLFVGEIASILEKKISTYVVEDMGFREFGRSTVEGFELAYGRKPAYAHRVAGEGGVGSRVIAEDSGSIVHKFDSGDSTYNKPSTNKLADDIAGEVNKQTPHNSEITDYNKFFRKGELPESVVKFLDEHGFNSAAKAEDINKMISGFYPKPPFSPQTKVLSVKLGSDTKGLVRVFEEGKNDAMGNFVMFAKEIEGLTTKQIQSKFGLSYTPTHIVDVIPDVGTEILIGKTAMNFGRKGGGVQGYFNMRIQRKHHEHWFKNIRELR